MQWNKLPPHQKVLWHYNGRSAPMNNLIFHVPCHRVCITCISFMAQKNVFCGQKHTCSHYTSYLPVHEHTHTEESFFLDPRSPTATFLIERAHQSTQEKARCEQSGYSSKHNLTQKGKFILETSGFNTVVVPCALFWTSCCHNG